MLDNICMQINRNTSSFIHSKECYLMLLKAFTVLTFLVSTVLADEQKEQSTVEQDASSERLFANWGGLVPWLDAKGLSFELIQTTDFFKNTSGGLDRTSGALGNTDLTFTLDSAKANLWEGGTFFMYFLGNYGKDPSTIVGDAQVSNNIEAYDTFKLYEAWYNHDLNDGKVSVLVGLHDLNSEFYSLDTSGNLINSSFGVGPDVSQVGPSIFSTTSLAARVRVLPSENLYVAAAVYDGVPGDPQNARGTRIKFDSGDGLFSVVEAGISGNEENLMKLALGGWYHTASFEDVSGNQRDRNYGGYSIGEKKLWSEEDAAQGLAGFFQYGSPASARNVYDRYFGVGLAYTGLVPYRDEDVLSLGLAQANFGNNFRKANEGIGASEKAYEVNYRVQVSPSVAISPDVQFIVDPIGDSSVNDAVVATVRTELVF